MAGKYTTKDNKSIKGIITKDIHIGEIKIGCVSKIEDGEPFYLAKFSTFLGEDELQTALALMKQVNKEYNRQLKPNITKDK